jgi:hypothetical protein
MLFAPAVDGIGATSSPSGLGDFTFSEAVVINILVSVIAGIVSNYVFKSAFTTAGRKI